MNPQIHKLAAHLLGLDPAASVDPDRLSIQLADRTGLDMDALQTAVSLLLPLTPPLTSPLTGQSFHTFGYEDGNAWTSLVKTPVETRPASAPQAAPEPLPELKPKASHAVGYLLATAGPRSPAALCAVLYLAERLALGRFADTLIGLPVHAGTNGPTFPALLTVLQPPGRLPTSHSLRTGVRSSGALLTATGDGVFDELSAADTGVIREAAAQAARFTSDEALFEHLRQLPEWNKDDARRRDVIPHSAVLEAVGYSPQAAAEAAARIAEQGRVDAVFQNL